MSTSRPSRHTDVRHRPCSLVGPGEALVFCPSLNARGLPSKARGWSAERRILVGVRLAAERALRKRARRPALHLRRFLSPEPYFRVGADALAPLIRPALAGLQPHRVQPFKAAPLSGCGR